MFLNFSFQYPCLTPVSHVCDCFYNISTIYVQKNLSFHWIKKISRQFINEKYDLTRGEMQKREIFIRMISENIRKEWKENLNNPACWQGHCFHCCFFICKTSCPPECAGEEAPPVGKLMRPVSSFVHDFRSSGDGDCRSCPSDGDCGGFGC